MEARRLGVDSRDSQPASARQGGREGGREGGRKGKMKQNGSGEERACASALEEWE